MKEGQVFPGSKRSKDSKSSAAGDDDQGTESDEGSSVDPLPSNPSSVTLHFDSESDHINASLSGFEANNLSHSQPSSEFEELKFETPMTLTLKQNQPKTSTLPAQAHLSVTSPTSEPQISQSSDVIQCSSSEITVSERRDTLPPDATVLTTFGNLPDLVTQQDNTGFDVAEAENHHRAEEKEHDIVASASFSRTEKTGNESARVAELEQVSNSIGDVSDLEKFDAILLKIREPKGTPLEEVHELEKNARHTEEESEIFNTRPTTTELNETIENRSIKLSDSVQRVITELGETDDLLHETSELDEHAKQAEDVRVVERVELELSEVTEQDNQLAVESISEEVKYFGHMDSQNSTSRSVQAGFLHSEVPAVDVDLQILTDTTKELIADRLPDNSSDSSLLQDSTDGQEDISLQKEVWLSPTSPSSPFTLSDLDGTDDTVEETIQTNEFSKADVADEDVLDAHFSSSGFREEKNEPREVKLSGNFFTEMQNREENLSLHSSADKESFIVEEKSSVSVRESSFQKEKQPKNKSNNELDRKDAAEDWTDSRTQGKSLYEEDTREKETKEAIIGKNVYGDYQRRKPAVEKDPKEELSQEEKGKEQKREIDKNEDSLEAEEKIQTAEKDLNEGDYEEEEGEKGQIDEEDFYKDDFVEEDQGDQTMQKDLTEDSSNEEEECETEEDVSATEEDSLEFKEEEEEERTVEEDLSEVEGDSLELEDQREETGEEELTEDDSQENDGIRERMKVENDFSIEDFHEADSLEKEDDAQTAEEEPSVSEEDSLEPRKDDESSIGDEELTEEDSLGREEDEETMEEEISPTEEGEEMEGEDEMERDVTKHAVKDDGKANVKDEIVPAEEDDMGSKINENRGTEKTKEDKKTGGVGNTGMIQKDETKESQQGTEITQDVQKDLNQEEEGADRKDFIESPRLTVPLPKTTEVEVEIPMINQHMQSRITGGTTGGTTGVTTGETTGMTIGGTTGGTARGTTGVTTGVTTREPTGMTIGATSGMTIGATAGGTTGGTIGGTTKMMETLIAEDEIGMTSDEEMRIFEEEERRITEEERRLVQMREAQTAADEKTEEHEKRKTGMFEQNKTGFDSNEEVRTIEKQVAEQSELKQALAADGQDRGTTANDWKETSEKEERRRSLENEMTDINKIRTSERGQVGIQNEEQQTNEEFGQRIKPKEMESNQQMLDLKSDTGTSGYGKTEASDKDRMMQIGTGMTENKRREITEEKKPVEEQRIRTKEDEEMVQQEKTTAEKDSEEQLTRTKEGEEMVKEEKTTAEKDSEEQLTRTNEDEEMVGQERKTAENDSEKQLTRTEEDEEMVEEEKTTAEKDLKEQRTRIEEDEEMVEEEKTTAEKDSEEQLTRTKEDEEMVEEEKTAAEKDSEEQETRTKDEEMVEQERITAEIDSEEQLTSTKEDEEMVEEKKTTAEKDSEEHLTRTEDEEMVEQERTNAEIDSEEQLTRSKEDEEMVEEQRTTVEKDLEEPRTRTKENEEVVQQEKKTAEKDLEARRTRTKEYEEMVEQEKKTAEKDSEEQQTRTRDEEMVEEEKTTKENEEMVEEEKTTAEKDSKEQRTRTEEDEEMVKEEKTTAEKDLMEQRTRTEEDEEMVKEEMTTAEKDLKEQRTRAKQDEEMVEQEKTTAEKDSEEQQTRTIEDEEMVKEEKTIAEKDLEEHRTRIREDEEMVKQEKTTGEKDVGEAYSLEEGTEEQLTRTKKGEEMVGQERITAEKDSEEQLTRTKDEEMVEEEKTTAEKYSGEQLTRTKEDEEMVEEEKTTAEKDLEEPRTRTKENEEVVQQEKTTAEKDSGEQLTRTKEDEAMVEQERTNPEKDLEEPRTRTKEDEEMLEQEITTSEKYLEEERTRTKEDEEMVGQERPSPEKDLEKQRTRTKEDEEMVEQERITPEKDLEEQRTRTKEGEEMIEQEKTAAEKNLGEENSEEEGTVTTENVETQFAKTKERGMNDMEQTGLTTEKEKTGKTEQWEIPAMTKQETTEGSGRKKSGIVPVETRVTEKEKPGVSVKSKTDVTQHEELGTQEQEAAGKIKAKAPDKTGTSEGEIVVEQNTCKAEEEETEISEEAKISENKERGTYDDEEMETSEKDITGAFVRNENKISGEDDTRLIDDKVEIIIEERDAEESIKMSKENKSEINGVDKNGLGSGFEISEKTGMPSITACGADNIEDTNDEILCDGTHEKRKKELKNSAEMAITSHFGKEMTLEENKTKAATDDASMTSLNETELTTGSQMGISDDEENYIQADHRLKVEDHEEIEKKPQKRNSYVDDNFVDDVLEPGFAFSIMSSDSELDTDDEALFFGEKELTTGQLCRMPAQSHRKRHESYDEEDEDPVWSGYEPVVLFSDESLQSASRSTPRFHGDGLYFEKLSPNMKSAVSTHASSNQFPLRHDQISQSEISNDSMLKQNHDATKRDLELARLLNLPQKSFASSVGNGQIGSKFGVSKEAKQASETQNNLPFPVGSSWLPPTTAAEKGAEIKKNPLTFGKSSRWTNDSSQFAHPDQQVTLEDSYLVPNGMALGGTTRESKTLHEDFGSMSGKSWQTHRNSVNGRANGIMSNSANGAVNGSVSYSASGGVNGKIGNGDSGRYHGSVDNSVGLLMCQSCTAQRLYGSSDGTLNELGDVWSRLRGSHTEDCEGKMSHLEEMIHPLECNHQTPTTPTSLSCFISPLSKQQEPQRPSGTAYRFMGKGTFTKSSRDDTATFPVHDYLEGDTLWKAEKARIFKGLNLRPTKFSSAYVTARNATPRSVEDQQQTSSISALVDNMKSINSRLRKEADDHLWKENLALWKELEQEHLTYKRELELHQTNQRRNNRTIKDLQQQISFLETEMSKRIMTLHDFTRP